MHEISLVQGLMQQLTELAMQNNATKVLVVSMKIGPLSGVVEDSFRFGFEILSAENDMVRGAQLMIDTTAVTYRCTKCDNTERSTSARPDCCPSCGELFLIAEGGDELILERVEME